MIQCTIQFQQWTNHNPRGEARNHWLAVSAVTYRPSYRNDITLVYSELRRQL